MVQYLTLCVHLVFRPTRGNALYSTLCTEHCAATICTQHSVLNTVQQHSRLLRCQLICQLSICATHSTQSSLRMYFLLILSYEESMVNVFLGKSISWRVYFLVDVFLCKCIFGTSSTPQFCKVTPHNLLLQKNNLPAKY